MNFNENQRNINNSSKMFHSSNTYNKYINNNIENPNLKFSDKDSRINMELVNKIENKNLFDKNNSIFLQKILDNLISAKLYKSDYDEGYKFLLFKSLQNSLDYLTSKKSRIIKINNILDESLKKINKQTNDLEIKLENNKNLIEEKSKRKNELKYKYEELKKKYKEMKDQKEQARIKETKINIETKIVEQNLEENITQNITNTNIKQTNDKYFCKVCNEKFFLSQEDLEDHQIKRHPFLIIRKPPVKKENKINKKYNKKLDDLKKYFQNLYYRSEEKEKNNDSLRELIKKREENNVFFENILENQEKIYEDIQFSFKNMIDERYKFINEFIAISQMKKNEKEIKTSNIREKKEQIKVEKSIKEEVPSNKITNNLNKKSEYFSKELNNNSVLQNKESKIIQKNEKKNPSFCEVIPPIDIKEKKSEILNDNEDKKPKNINSFINKNSENFSKEDRKNININDVKDVKQIQKNKLDEENIQDIKKEKNQNKKEKEEEKKNRIKEFEKEIEKKEEKKEGEKYKNKQEKQQKKEIEKIEFKKNLNPILEKKEEEEEDENEKISILSKFQEETPFEIVRTRNIDNFNEKNKEQKEISKYLDNIFFENGINFGSKNDKDNNESFEIINNEDLQNDIKVKNENKEKQLYKVENIYYEIPIHTNKKLKIVDSELDDLFKGL